MLFKEYLQYYENNKHDTFNILKIEEVRCCIGRIEYVVRLFLLSRYTTHSFKLGAQCWTDQKSGAVLQMALALKMKVLTLINILLSGK